MWLGIPVIGLTLWAWGQPVFCRSGEFHFWVNSIWSSENSQQLADWYTVSHMVMGMAIALVGRVFRTWARPEIFLAAAICIGIGWELVEHTDFVLDRFRGQTIYQGYLGDTVLNAVADYLFMMAAFFVVRDLPTALGVVLMLVLELTSVVVARDSLILTTLRVVHPIPAIVSWQDETRPGGPPPQARSP